VDNFCGLSRPRTILVDMMKARITRFRSHLRAFVEDETGDVPGWVLVTLMTAGLVVLIWAVAGPALTGLFEQAISRVSGL
jgi:hypothetical protein